MADKKKDPSATKNYTLLRGTHDYRDDDGNLQTAVVGDSVPLTEAQYQNFR
jgi:hypothetical protein